MELIEPMGLTVPFHEDDRAQRLLDCFGHFIEDGQVNITYVRTPGHVVAWHKHMNQTDVWIVLQGSLKVGIVKDDIVQAVRFHYLSDKCFKGLIIPPNHWHGYMALEPNTILMYYMTEKYDPDDELREKVGAFGEDWRIEQK